MRIASSACVACAAALSLTAVLAPGCGSASALEGKDAPAFSLKDIDGDTISLEQLKGRGVILSFFFVGCGPCRAEAPYLSKLAEKYWEKGLRVVAINVRPEETVDVVGQFARSQNLKHLLLVGGSEVAMRYDVHAVPANFFIDKWGKVVGSEVGFDPQALEAGALKVLPSSK